MTEKLIPQPDVTKRIGISAMTLHRWRNDPELNFPVGITIRKRVYYRLHEIEEFCRKRFHSAA